MTAHLAAKPLLCHVLFTNYIECIRPEVMTTAHLAAKPLLIFIYIGILDLISSGASLP